MPYQTREPSVKLVVDKSLFNKLLGILDFNINLHVEDNNFSKDAEKLKEKLMTYTVPRVNEEENIQIADIRFFPNEAGMMIKQLLTRASSYIEEENYYEVLIENRNSRNRN